MSKNNNFLSEQVREKLSTFLNQFNYSYKETYIRPRGIALEYTCIPNSLFAVCEGGVLYVDLLVCNPKSNPIRISLNQLIWYSGNRDLLGIKGCTDQLDKFICIGNHSNEMADILHNNENKYDSRYCFEMSQDNLKNYLAFQRGE